MKFTRTDNSQSGNMGGPQLSHICDTPTSVYTKAVTATFAFPDDQERKDLARLATVDCPNAGFRAKVTAFHHPIAGLLRTCAVATWQVVNTLPEPDVVLWQHQINECRTNDGKLEFPTDLPLPGSDPTGIEVRLQGQVRIECQAASPTAMDAGNVSVGFTLDDRPILSWPRCFPGWDP